MTTKTLDHSLNRFASPTSLTGATRVMGATAKQWDEALTGDMENSLKLVRARVQAMHEAALAGKIDVRHVPSGDLASAIKRRKMSTGG